MQKKLIILMVGSIFIASSIRNATAQSWNITGNNNTTPLSKLGTTNLIPLSLYTNNAERIRIDETGRVGIGISAPVNILTVKSTAGNPSGSWLTGLTSPVFVGFADNASSEFVLATASNVAVRRSVIQGRKSRGTLAAPAVVADNDYLTSFLASGYDGNAFQNPATIDFFVDGTPSAGNVPARISFVTGSNQSNRKERLKVGSTGNFNFNVNQLTLQQSTGNVGIGSGNLNFSNGFQTIQFASPGDSSNPMINLFDSGTANANRMVIAHSPAYPKWGLEYRDANDEFEFRSSEASVLHVGLGSGRVGIGTTTPAARFDVVGAATQTSSVIQATTTYSGELDISGIYSQSNTAEGFGIGMLGVGGYIGGAFLGDGNAYDGGFPVVGVYGYALGSSGTGSRYGVYGFAEGGETNFAGYFDGDITVAGLYNPSDRKLKTDIALMKNSSQQIMKLKPSTYLYKTGEFGKMQLPSGNQMGLIADELKQVFPELVREAVQPAEFNKDRTRVVRPEIKYDVINYIGLIPLLVGSAQEQQKQIELQQAQIQEQQNQIKELKEMVYQLSAEKGIKASINNVNLEQNNPNPLDKFTNIRYSIPAGSKNAQLVVIDINGKKVKQVQLGTATTGNISFDATGLANGTYTYSIIVDGKLTQSKKMVVSKISNY